MADLVLGIAKSLVEGTVTKAQLAIEESTDRAMADLVLGVAKSLAERTVTKVQLAIEESSKLRQSAQHDLVFIAGEFEMMHSFLSVTTEEHLRNNIVSTWLTQVCDLAYDVEDCIEFIHLDTKSDWWLRFIKCCNCMAPALPLDEASTDIEQLKARVHDVSQRNIRLISDVGPKPIKEMKQPGPATSGASSGMCSKTRDTDWMQQDLEELIKLITRKGSGLEVISVWATWGDFVSTSIIRKAFDDPNVWENFTCRAWVKLSHPFNLHNLIRSLLDQFYANFCEVQQEAIIETCLVQEFMQQVNNQTYLIFLEDVSTMVEWEAIRKYLPDRRNGSRIIVSTRQFEIASFCTGLPYYQRFSAESACIFFKEVDLVGMEEPMRELQQLLVEEAKDNQGLPLKQLKVISVVGAHGLGKTALAMEVYKSLDPERFSCRAWVDTSKYRDAKGVLMEIVRAVIGESTSQASSSAARHIKDLRTYLHKKERFLIVLDDIQPGIWETIRSAFPENDGNSRIIVVTSIYSVAMQCSYQTGHVYRMQALENDHSKALFRKILLDSHRKCEYNLDKVSECILKKCAGVPLSIVGTAQLLRVTSDEMTWNFNQGVSKEQIYLRSNPAIERMKQVITRSFHSLYDPFLQSCFLSLSMFPEGHVIKAKGLLRRWAAEGLATGVRLSDLEVANGYFQNLVDRNLIKPLEISNNGNVKTCQIHGIIFDFIVYNSIRQTNCSLIHNDKLLQSSQVTRRFSFHSISEESENVAKKIDLSRIRSLSIFNHVGGDGLVNIQKCKLVRVLDLENCQGLSRNFLDGICELLLLKYLSLRDTDVKDLPVKISKLQHLSTLDIRGTQVKSLRMEVLTLPQLANLFGRFQLPNQHASRKLQSFFEEKSKLQTLAGFALDDSPAFKLIMAHLPKLRKIKIWSGGTTNDYLNNILISSLQKHFSFNVNRHFQDRNALIIDFGRNESLDFMDDLDAPCTLGCVKLTGCMTKLPRFIGLVQGLRELCLSSSYLRCEVLSDLHNLRYLQYLKLDFQEFIGDSLSVTHPLLLRLCIVTRKLPQVRITAWDMPHITSLHLLCGDVEGLPSSSIQLLKSLIEIRLGDVSEETRKSWKDEAKRHKNRPMIN
ncbi:unnamed protein product [Urochloa decumbens]|uniref:Uncharacterized protein n=1 Tax=Urochloa decumbens TaxID=240449 RepID=A0ABC9AUI3_9POAL